MTGEISQLTLVLGGARSGKSAFAEMLVEDMSPARVYLATALAADAEMQGRIRAHRNRRGSGWQTVEAPIDLTAALSRKEPVLLDCLTLWLANAMEAGSDIEAATRALLDAIAARSAPLVAVSNELGMGLVPETQLGRTFRDAQGSLNQAFAARAGRVVFVVSGLPMWLKGAP